MKRTLQLIAAVFVLTALTIGLIHFTEVGETKSGGQIYVEVVEQPQYNKSTINHSDIHQSEDSKLHIALSKAASGSNNGTYILIDHGEMTRLQKNLEGPTKGENPRRIYYVSYRENIIMVELSINT